MADKIKWGVIGSGGIARRKTVPEGIVPADNAQLLAVYDVNAQANAEVAKEFNAQAVDSIDALLGANIDAVYLATPANLHCEQVIQCAKASKHVLCEKPLGMSATQTKKMIAACNQAEVLLGTAFMIRFHTQHKAALEMIKQGKLGTLAYGRAQMSCWYPPIEGAWRQDPATGGGGSLMDMGGHCIDLLEMFFGKVKKVSCLTNNIIHNYKSEDAAVTLLFFENGALATVDNFFCVPDTASQFALEIYGSKGAIIAKHTINQGDHGEMTAYIEQSDAGYDAQQAQQSAEPIAIAPEPYNTYRAEIEEFSQAIIEGREPYNNAELGLRSEKILEACYQSAKSGRTVEID